jgi:hypothetical protein
MFVRHLPRKKATDYTRCMYSRRDGVLQLRRAITQASLALRRLGFEDSLSTTADRMLRLAPIGFLMSKLISFLFCSVEMFIFFSSLGRLNAERMILRIFGDPYVCVCLCLYSDAPVAGGKIAFVDRVEALA